MMSGSCGGEEAGALHRRQLERIAQHQHLGAEAEEVAAERFVHHRDFVDDDEIGRGRLAFGVERRISARRPCPTPANRSASEWWRRHVQPFLRITMAALPVKAAYFDRLHALREVAGECRLAGAGPAEQPEHLRAGLVLEPGGDGLKRLVLLRRPFPSRRWWSPPCRRRRQSPRACRRSFTAPKRRPGCR